MFENKTFQVALLVSVLVHSVFFLGIPHMSFFPTRRSLETLTITYYKINERPERKTIARKRTKTIAKRLPEIKKEEILKPPRPAKKKTKKAEVKKRRVAAVEKATGKKFETVIKEEQDDAKKATYISYYRAVREKIRQYADRDYPRNRRLDTGEVFLSFVVASSGELLQVKVVDSKSTKAPLLRSIAINSIRDASPFPPFPKGMNQYQITFNVIISFEVNR